jgi:L-amino acid N-acyltransferase YncA
MTRFKKAAKITSSMQPDAITLRSATPQDAAALLDIYAPYVRSTAISFELEPPSVDEFAARIHKCAQDWAWLVAERRGAVLGYAYASAHRERAAYRWSVETSVYVAASAKRQGIGKRLYEALFATLTTKGFCNAYAGIALPNEASVALHQSLGFQPIGIFPAVGRKFDTWHDVAWFHRPLGEFPTE